MKALALPLALFVAVTSAAHLERHPEPYQLPSPESVRTASLAAGQAAGLMCSAVFIAARAPDAVRREELDRLALVPDELYPETVDVERASRSAIAKSRFGETRRAAYREGLGCVLMAPGSSVDDISRLPQAPLAPPPGDPEKIRWPDGDLTSGESLPADFDKAALSTLVARAFDPNSDQPSYTLSVVVVYRGRIIAERYAPGWSMHTAYRSWSTGKSITSALIGLLVDAGKAKVDEPAPIPEWKSRGDPRSKITLENLLHMSSGLNADGTGGEGDSYTARAYWGGVDTARLITSTTLGAAPGSRWMYSNFDSLLLLRAVRSRLASDRAYLIFPREALFHRIGMRHTVMEIDPYGNFIGSSQIYTTARDLARFGLLFLNAGLWNGKRILSEEWVRFSSTPPPANPAAEYTTQWWRIGLDARVPGDAYSTNGARGQFLTIVPSRDLIVVRQGLDPFSGERGWSQARFVAEVISTFH